MSRLSREKRDQKGADAPVLAAAPIDVLVGPAGASVGGVPVSAVPGEEIQHTVLNHLQRIALATGHPVHATVHDERIGYVVALRIESDGTSQFTAEPVPTAPPGERGAVSPGEPGRASQPGEPRGVSGSGEPTGASRPGEPGQVSYPTAPPALPAPPAAPAAFAPAAAAEPAGAATPPALPSAPSEAAAAQPALPDVPRSAHPAEPVDQPHRGKPTHLLRQTPEPPTFPIRAVPEPGPVAGSEEPRDAVPTFRLRAVPEWVADAVPGTVAPPTGQFGPPPVMDAPGTDAAGTDVRPAGAPASDVWPEAGAQPVSAPQPTPLPQSTPAPKPFLDLAATRIEDPDPKPTPPRGFDAVAEAVLGDDPATAYDGGGTVFLTGPMARINEAVKEGRIADAAQLAEQTVVEASRTLGPEHPEVLRLLELTAYIAYLAGDPVRAFGLSLDLARVRRHARDAEAAYGNVQSAATAWRAVRDPEQGLRMGVELIGLWTELTMEDGPAVEDVEQLESARTRMGRLAERARKLNS